MTQKNPYLPYSISTKLPETATISYYDVESDQNLTQEEGQQLHPKNNADAITIFNKSGGNFASEKEGYGPCYVCNLSEVTVEFKMACPAENCNNNKASYGNHDRDGCRNSRMLITNRGRLSCGNCALKLNMSNGNFACSRHFGEYRPMSQDSGEMSMAYALCMKNTNNATKQLNVYVTNHPEEFGFQG